MWILIGKKADFIKQSMNSDPIPDAMPTQVVYQPDFHGLD